MRVPQTRLYSVGIRVLSDPVEVWLRRPLVGPPGISTEQVSALAAANGGMWGWLQTATSDPLQNSYAALAKPPSPRAVWHALGVSRQAASGFGGERGTRRSPPEAGDDPPYSQ